jgi:hypothetical protein
MPGEQIPADRRSRPEEYDELQRGQEAPLSVETMERLAPPVYGPKGEVFIPDPGERPGAVRVGAAATETPAVLDPEEAPAAPPLSEEPPAGAPA